MSEYCDEVRMDKKMQKSLGETAEEGHHGRMPERMPPMGGDKPERQPDENDLTVQEVRDALWQQMMGIHPPPDWLDESQAPGVDDELLRRFRRNELAQEETLRICQLILNFRTWASAYVSIVKLDILKDRTKN